MARDTTDPVPDGGGTDPEWQFTFDRLAPVIVGHLGARSGGIWIDSAAKPPIIHVAVIDPSQNDADWLAAQESRGVVRIAIQSVRCSSTQLEMFHETIDTLIREGPVVATWVDPTMNKVHVEMNRSDPAFVIRLHSVVPPDALAVRVQPGASAVRLGEGDLAMHPGSASIV